MDNSATTRPLPEVAKKVYEVMTDQFGNPSSLHRIGMDAEKIVKEARSQFASAVNADPKEIFFTSGGTESDNWALFGGTRTLKRRGRKVITTAVEHPAVLEPCKVLEEQGFQVVYIPVDEMCRLDMDMLESEVDDDTIMISVMHVNNETGAVNDLQRVGEIRKKAEKKAGHNILFHSDCVQSLGKIKLDAAKLKGIDMMSFSGHKIGGPKGTGAMYLRYGLNLRSYMPGGGQESGMRSGTENVPGIAGLGTAADALKNDLDQNIAKMSSIRSYMLQAIKDEIKDIRINSPENGCESVLNISFLGCRGEVLLHMLEGEGVYISTGSACSSNKKGRSHVLRAMGLDDDAIEGAIRFSFCGSNTLEEAEYAVDKLKTCVSRFRLLGKFR